jgi:hypothetical protein
MHEMLLDRIKTMTLKVNNNLHKYSVAQDPLGSGRVLKMH